MDSAEAIYELLRRDGAGLVRRFIDERKAENVLLDFKEKSNRDGHARLGDDDKKNYSKALSGFANSAGGVLIWGVEDKRQGEESVAWDSKPVSNIQQFIQNLESYLPEAVARSVDGVRNDILPIDSGAGYVMTYVPESPRAPHRAEFDRQYYKRIGDSFRKLEHFDVEDMFGRRGRPVLDVAIGSEAGQRSANEHHFSLKVSVTNSGRAMCRFFGIDLDVPSGCLGEHASFRGQLVHVSSRITRISYRTTSGDPPLFPGETVLVLPNNYRGGHLRYRVDDRISDDFDRLDLTLAVYADNTPAVVKRLRPAEFHQF